ncbi:alpha/beta fold hydrolase [Streptomyces xanthophaeus]
MTAAEVPPIAFVHGTRFSAGQWSPQLAALREEFPVVAVDLPGHGARSGQPWSLDAAAEVIACAVDSLDRGPALVVGHSLGGYASLEFARRCPERLRGLVLAGASASPSTPCRRLGRGAGPLRRGCDAACGGSRAHLERRERPLFRSGEREFARAHPHARVELIPRARHLADFDDPDAFTDAVRRFARQLPIRS